MRIMTDAQSNRVLLLRIHNLDIAAVELTGNYYGHDVVILCSQDFPGLWLSGLFRAIQDKYTGIAELQNEKSCHILRECGSFQTQAFRLISGPNDLNRPSLRSWEYAID